MINLFFDQKYIWLTCSFFCKEVKCVPTLNIRTFIVLLPPYSNNMILIHINEYRTNGLLYMFRTNFYTCLFFKFICVWFIFVKNFKIIFILVYINLFMKKSPICVLFQLLSKHMLEQVTWLMRLNKILLW